MVEAATTKVVTPIEVAAIGIITPSDTTDIVKMHKPTERIFFTRKSVEPIQYEGGNLNLRKLNIQLSDGHGYNRSDLTNNYVMGGVVQSVDIAYQKPNNEEGSQAETKKINGHINLADSELSLEERRAMIRYDGATGNRISVAFSRALEEYCKTQTSKRLEAQKPPTRAREHRDRRGANTINCLV